MSSDSPMPGDDPDPLSDLLANFPDEVAILPLRGLTVYPYTAIPLTVGQPRSVLLVEDVVESSRLVGLVMSRDPEKEMPNPDEIYSVGTLASIHRLLRAPDGTIRLLVQALYRIHIDDYTASDPYLKARIRPLPETVEQTLEVEALARTLVDQFTKLADLIPTIPTELVSSAINIEDPLQLVYAIATYVRIDLHNAQRMLELDSVEAKMRLLAELLNKELDVLELGRKIQNAAQTEMEKSQREYYLREQMRAIQRELEEGDEQLADVEMFRRKIDAVGMTDEGRQEALRELDRLEKIPIASAEYGVIRTYLDWITSLPWSTASEDHLDIARARAILEEDHYGLKDIKARILEYLAVRKLRAERAAEFEAESSSDLIRRERKGAILCFIGPPGVGKTSLGASIARAMGRKFIRMSLGGVRDESEIRGFRRTYIGALPGRIIQTIRRVEVRNPLIMLDEVDKLGHDFRGDPASALLEVLDPEQNAEFRDHYLDVAFDLSEVLFITTANEMEPIPGPLLDRMEIIQLSGYTEQEKLAIARQYLIPRQRRENGLRPAEIDFRDDAIAKIIRDYTREAGVRSLEREIGRVARKVVVQIAENSPTPAVIDADKAAELLGHPRYGYQTELEERTDLPGVATGLAWTAVGGEVLFVEATRMPGGKGFKYTGHLGEVMQESAQLALSYLRAKASELGIDPDFYNSGDIHLHVPAGAVPKDGPSAGVTMVVALASLLTNRPTRSNIAMTGEITLRGQVLPVGGIKDKVLAAHRLGVDTVIIPRKNATDLEDLTPEVRDHLTFILAENLDQVLAAALTDDRQNTVLSDTLNEERIANEVQP